MIVACLFSAGCSSYGWAVFQDNALRPTPYMKVAHRPEPKQWPDDRLTLAWIGHATVLINFFGTTILTDPVLTDRLAPPHLCKGLNLGIRRIAELPLTFKELPRIDLVLLSHAHHDHWDEATLKYFGKDTRAIIPVGNRDIVPAGSFGEVTELGWGQQAAAGGLTIRAFRVEHWGRRYGAKEKQRGFNGYVISGKGKRIVFIGDTTFGNRERLIPETPTAQLPRWVGAPIDWAKRLNIEPPDVCILPIGEYFYHLNHVSPEQAWSVFMQLRGKWLLPIHWRTFILTPRRHQPTFEPIERLRKAAGSEGHRIICDEPGKTFVH